MTDEDLIESAPAQPKRVWRRRVERSLRQPTGIAAVLVVGVVTGYIAGYVVGQANPRALVGISQDSLTFEPFFEDQQGVPHEQVYGRTPPPLLGPADLAGIGENVTNQFGVLTGRSAIPILCGAGVGQPATSDEPSPGAAATVFRVDGGKITQLIWLRPDDASASGTLQTLVAQAQLCPDIPNSAARIVTDGVQTGIGDEYAVFHRKPTRSGPDVFFATVVLVRVGADLIEVSFTSDIIDIPDAEPRCLRAAAAAVRKAIGG